MDENLTTSMSRFEAAVSVLEANDVLDLGRRDLEDGRVLERLHAVNRARAHAEGCSGPDDLRVRRLVARRAELDLRAARMDQPRLVLHAVELEAQRLTGFDEQDLPAVVVGERPEQLVAPRLLDPGGLDAELGEPAEVRRRQVVHVRAPAVSQSGFARRCSSAIRRSFGVFTVSHRPEWRYA